MESSFWKWPEEAGEVALGSGGLQTADQVESQGKDGLPGPGGLAEVGFVRISGKERKHTSVGFFFQKVFWKNFIVFKCLNFSPFEVL